MARISRWGKQPEPPRSFMPEVMGAWIYGRLSLENSRSEESIETQIAFCKHYIDLQSDLSYKGFFDDVGHTGTNMNRPRFNDLMAKILDGEIRCIVVKDLSRLGRTYLEVGELLFDTFIQLGVRFISVNDNYDSFAPDAGRKKLLILVKNLRNSQYSKDLGQKISAVIKTNQQNGKPNGGVPPYGYWLSEDKQSYYVVPEAAAIVKMIFDLYNTGMGTGRICEYLNANGYPSPRYHYFLLGLQKESNKTKCQTWMPNSVIEILRNQAYIGCMVQGKYEKSPNGKNTRVPSDRWIIHPNRHSPIIDIELFESAQIKLADKTAKTKKARTGEKHEENIFVGKTFCSRCGRAACRDSHVNKRNKKKIYPTYYCRYCLPELKRANNIRGKSMALRLADLESVVFAEITRQINICHDIDVMLAEAANAPHIARKRRELSEKRERLNKDSGKAVELLTAAYTHHASGLLNEDEFNAVRVKFELDKQSALTAIAKVDEEIRRYDIDMARESEYIRQFRKFRGFTKLDKSIISALIKRIDITPLSNEITVTFNFADSFMRYACLLEESGVLKNAG